MSMVRRLVYSNQLDIEGRIATTSTWMRATVRPDVLHKVIAAYGDVRTRLEAQAPGYPTAAALDALVVKGQEGYGMAAVGADRLSPGAEAIIKAVDRPDARPLWVLGWVVAHAGAGPVPGAAHAHTGRPRYVRVQVARLRDLRSGRCWAVAAPHLFEPALHRDAVVAGRRGVRPRYLDRHQRLPLLPQRARRRLHDLLEPLDPGHIRSRGPLGALYIPPCCIHEGDTPSFLALIDNGLGSAMNPTYGGWGGRYVWRQPSGESRPFWTQGGDSYPGRETHATP